MRKFFEFLKENTVIAVALFASVVTAFIVRPDKAYLSYFDLKTLTCLFLTLAVICALKRIQFFSILAKRIVIRTGNLRVLALALVYITFIGSMIIANDMALITFLPLGYYSLSVTRNEKHMAYVFVLQNISANLGGMITPFGNPQNLYLYSFFNIPTGEFMGIMWRPFVLAIFLLTVLCFMLKPEKLTLENSVKQTLPPGKCTAYLLLMAFSLLIVFRVVPYLVGLLVIPVILFFMDRKALLEVDYGLLLTFTLFFIFSGNMARIELVNSVMSRLLSYNALIFSELSCQVISNVPSAILLSQFTENYRELLLGVNIGGTGTLIASLASLITFNHYRALYPDHTKEYLLTFAALNVFFLVVMTVFSYFFFT
ncbi:MAG: citrate transporter [Clostridia bacterium]|nr:citrate transporter [Clostridia bacterium]